MAIAYCRDDPVSARWTGLDRLLSEFEIDFNFYQVNSRLTTVEASLTTTISIGDITSDGSSLTVVLTDASTKGPFPMPVAAFRDRGAWTISTAYLVNDTFTANGNLYRVLFNHTSSATTFDPTANDGLGHDYYAAMMSQPGNALPNGGATGMFLKKSSSSDYSVTWGFPLPNGGTTHQVLMKSSSVDQAFTWSTMGATMVSFTPSTASHLTSTNVAAALEELETRIIPATQVSYSLSTTSTITSTNVQGALDELDARTSAASPIGRQTIWVPASAMTPLITNGATVGQIELSGYNTVVKTLDFDDTTEEFAQFEIAMPKSWDGEDIFFKVYWSHATTSTNYGVAWNIGAVILNNASSIDVSLPGYTFGGIVDNGGAGDTLYISDESDAMSFLGLAGDTLLIFRIDRYPSDAGDTLAVDARLHGVQLYYTTSAATDN